MRLATLPVNVRKDTANATVPRVIPDGPLTVWKTVLRRWTDGMENRIPPAQPRRVGIYTRVSTEEQAVGGVSLEAQRDYLESYAKFHGWNVIKIYEDAGLSGGSIKRPQLQALMEDARNGLIDGVLVYKLDRLGRSLEDLIHIINEFQQHKVDFISATEQIDTTTAIGTFTFHLFAALAQFERGLIRERTSFAMDKKASDGFVQNRPPYGYRLANGKLHVIKKQAELVHRLYEGYLQEGMTLRKLAKETKLHKDTIHYILSNPIYTGQGSWKSSMLSCPSIVTKEAFTKVQQKLKASRLQLP